MGEHRGKGREDMVFSWGSNPSTQRQEGETGVSCAGGDRETEGESTFGRH